MIFVRDKGRMCNNLLQYGHVYAWGREHGRQTMSMRFAYKYPYFHICHTRWHNFPTYAAVKCAAKLGLLPVASFDRPDADSARLEALMLDSRHIVVEGWQARWYDLFLKYKEEILQLFAFDTRLLQTTGRLLDSLQPHAVRLGLHIRRGDYARWHGGRFFFTDRQYIAQVRQFLAMHKGEQVQLLICGNDPTLDEDAYRQAFPQCQVVFPKGNPGEDLCLLSQCHWLMGPPSTFTLVAAMYRDTPLCWIENAEAPLAFSRFDQLFTQIK